MTNKEKIQRFLENLDGMFMTRDVYEALGAKTKQDKNTIRVALVREAKAGSIENVWHGSWRKIDSHVEWKDLSVVR